MTTAVKQPVDHKADAKDLFDDLHAFLFLEINRESHRQLVERMELVQPSIDKIFAEASQELKREGSRPRFFQHKFAALLKRLGSLNLSDVDLASAEPKKRKAMATRLRLCTVQARRLKKRYDKVRMGKARIGIPPALHKVPTAQLGESRTWPRPPKPTLALRRPGKRWIVPAVREGSDSE